VVLLKIGGYICIIAGMGLIVLGFLIPEAKVGLVIGAFATLAAGVINLWVARALSPAMESIPKPEGVDDITTVRGAMQMHSALSRQGAAKIESATTTLREMNRSKNLREHGLKARAKVLAIRDTGQLVNFDPILEFDLEVLPEAGEPYQVEGYRQLVSKVMLPRIDVGGDYVAFVDPEERTSLFVLWQ
jgi:hypothetical protein